jgi:hypothetical protein
MLDIKDVIRIDKYYPPSKNGGYQKQYIFKCRSCDTEIKVKTRKRLITATGLCVKCNNHRLHAAALDARRLRPFEACWNRIRDSSVRRNLKFDLSYEDFLIFTNETKCHYCFRAIYFKKYSHAAYNLDRKYNHTGYIKDNLVVCCNICNKGKGALFSYEEWYGMTRYFRDKA